MGVWCGYIKIPNLNHNINVGDSIAGQVITYCSENMIGWDHCHLGDFIPIYSNGCLGDINIFPIYYTSMEDLKQEIHEVFNELINQNEN